MRSDLKAVENCQLPSPPLGVQQGGVQIPAPWRGNSAAQTNLRAIASAAPAEGADLESVISRMVDVVAQRYGQRDERQEGNDAHPRH